MPVYSPIKRINESSTLLSKVDDDTSTSRVVEILQNRSDDRLFYNRIRIRNRAKVIRDDNDTERVASIQHEENSPYKLRVKSTSNNHSTEAINETIDVEEKLTKTKSIDTQLNIDEIIENQINEGQDAVYFLIYVLILQRKNKRLATRFIMKFLNEQFLNDEFKLCDTILLAATSLINVLTDSVVLSLLSISYNAKVRLNNRKKFYDVSLAKFIEKYPPGHSKLIFNLA